MSLEKELLVHIIKPFEEDCYEKEEEKRNKEEEAKPKQSKK